MPIAVPVVHKSAHNTVHMVHYNICRNLNSEKETIGTVTYLYTVERRCVERRCVERRRVT